MRTTNGPAEMSRRQVLAAGAMGAVGWLGRPRTALGAVALRGPRQEPPDRVLVTIFLRGGADGLSLVAPYCEDRYYALRPTIGIAAPGDGRASASDRLIDLDGFYGLHPALAPLLPLYRAGQLAFIHACGSGDETRSHFEAMATMERGLDREDGPASGWLARHLESAPWENRTPLRAVALGALIPDSLRGAVGVTALDRIDDIRLVDVFSGANGAIRAHLARMYGSDRPAGDPLSAAGSEALAVLREIEDIVPAAGPPASGARYPDDELGAGLRQTSLLIKSRLGTEVAALDHVGYDTHVTQGSAQGALAGQLRSLGSSLAAFAADLGPHWARVTVVVLSEFGRRVEENSGAGTDHGHAGVMMVLGGDSIAGGRVHGRWPGLGALDGPGDLVATTDYRNVLAEVLARRIGNNDLSAVFPGLDYRPLGVTLSG
ncbi:MAG: DUF1501 domain-containing protein [Capsulimonadaceae bacterium]